MSPPTGWSNCDVCGGDIIIYEHERAKSWMGYSFSHKNPSICQRNIARKQEADAARIKELEAQLAQKESNNVG